VPIARFSDRFSYCIHFPGSIKDIFLCARRLGVHSNGETAPTAMNRRGRDFDVIAAG
jgi:hypothetical protein